MGNFQNITLPANNKKPSQTLETIAANNGLDVKMEDYIPDARQLLIEAGDDIGAQAEAIMEITRQLVSYNNKVKMMKYIDYLAKEFKIRKGDFTLAIREAMAEAKEAEDIDDGETSPLISRVEQYIRKRWSIYFNVVANRFMYKETDEKEFKEMNEHNIYRELQKAHLKFAMSDLKSLLRSDFIEKKNVFVEYFESLPPWDGTDWIDKLAGYVYVEECRPGVNERERFKRMFKKMFVRSVACSLEADFNKQCFTFVHEKQNSGKSTFMRWLCPPKLEDYYTENIGTSKDDLIALTENFIVNIDELSTLSKYDINSLKSVMSKHKVKVRLPYGERPELLQRRCNFVASTNRLEFLNDETGSVRWVCFLLDRLDWNYKKDININDVWTQAYHLYNETNFDYQLTPSEVEENEQANKMFLIRSPEMELIQKFMEPATREEHERAKPNVEFRTATEILTELNQKNQSNLKLSNVNVGKSLKILGFVQYTEYRSSIGISVKGYYVRYKNTHPLDDDDERKEVKTWKEPEPEHVVNGAEQELPF